MSAVLHKPAETPVGTPPGYGNRPFADDVHQPENEPVIVGKIEQLLTSTPGPERDEAIQNLMIDMRPPNSRDLGLALQDDAERQRNETYGEPKVERKETNPKDAVGIQKWRQYCTVPTTIIWELGVAMLEGARKYGRHNYRVAGVRGSVYVDAAKGHIDQWWEGEDIDEESGLSHITKAMASLAVLRDAMIHDKFLDDRPPKTDLKKLRGELQVAVDGIFERIPVAKDAYLEGDQHG